MSSVDALVLTKEDQEGRLLLSKKRARFEKAWRKIEAAAESGEPVEGTVIEVVKGGLILDLGVRGFLPASLVDIRRVHNLDEFKGETLECKVIELNRSRNNVVLSRRAVLEEERKEVREQILGRLQPGQIVEGKISNIVDFGAFVDLEGIDGLIHISELSWSHVNHPSEVLSIGETVRVKVLDIDRDRQRISLGLKQTQEDPWQKVLNEYRVGAVLEGKVTKVVAFGAFVEIVPGVEGLVHISELAEHHVESPGEVVHPDQEVWVRILEIDEERRRISLSVKRAETGNLPLRDLMPAELTDAATARRRARRGGARPGPLRGSLLRGASGRPTPKLRLRRRARAGRRGRGAGRRASPSQPQRPSPRPRSPRAREPAGGLAARALRRADGSGRRRQVRGAGRVRQAGSRDALQRSGRARPARRHLGCAAKLVERWGEEAAPGGEVDRARVGAIVFERPEELAWLESVLHPLVGERIAAWRSELPEDALLAVVEVPLLFEAGIEPSFDVTVAVVAGDGVRAGRAGERGTEQLAEREARQLPQEEKAARATHVLANDGTREELEAAVAALIPILAETGARA